MKTSGPMYKYVTLESSSTPVKTQSSTTHTKIVTPTEPIMIKIDVDDETLDGADDGLTREEFNKKYTCKGAKQMLIDKMICTGTDNEKSMSMEKKRGSVRDVIEKKQQRKNLPISNNIDVRTPDAHMRYETFRVEFGDYAAQIPRFSRTNADAFKDAGVNIRSKRKKVRNSENSIQWAGKKYLISEWNDLLDSWEQKYPCIGKRGDDEQIANREERESLNKFRIDCWNHMRPVLWPVRVGVVTTIPEWFRAKYKLDIWGNVVTMDVSISITQFFVNFIGLICLDLFL